MKRSLPSAIVLAVVTLPLLSSAVAESSDPPVRSDVYDYSSPEASFGAFQKAIRKEDLEGILVHAWFIGRGTAKASDPTPKFSALVQDFRSRKNFSFAAIDAGATEGLKLTEARFVKEVSRKHQEENGGVTTCTFLVEWPEARKRAHLKAFKLDSAKDWWFWSSFGCGDEVRVFDDGKDQGKSTE